MKEEVKSIKVKAPYDKQVELFQKQLDAYPKSDDPYEFKELIESFGFVKNIEQFDEKAILSMNDQDFDEIEKAMVSMNEDKTQIDNYLDKISKVKSQDSIQEVEEQ